jgi:hypothetical protein
MYRSWPVNRQGSANSKQVYSPAPLVHHYNAIDPSSLNRDSLWLRPTLFTRSRNSTMHVRWPCQEGRRIWPIHFFVDTPPPSAFDRTSRRVGSISERTSYLHIAQVPICDNGLVKSWPSLRELSGSADWHIFVKSFFGTYPPLFCTTRLIAWRTRIVLTDWLFPKYSAVLSSVAICDRWVDYA